MSPTGSDLDLAIVGNGLVAALVDSTGAIVWLGMPDMVGRPVADALLGGPAR
jgi:hypothetical protein